MAYIWYIMADVGNKRNTNSDQGATRDGGSRVNHAYWILMTGSMRSAPFGAENEIRVALGRLNKALW